MEGIKKLLGRYPRLSTFISAVIVLLVFYQVRFGLRIFDPTIISWIMDDVELAYGYFSFGYYRYQEIGFPIGKVDYYFYPLGGNLYTTDIPLLALIFRPFSSILPSTFQYLGLWYLISHLLQAWFGVLLAERFGFKGIPRLLVVLFFIFAPLLLSRFVNPALFCQWMILASLWVYLIDPEKTPVKKILRYQLIVFITAGLVFPHMWAMIFGFTVALFLRLWFFDKKLKFYQAAYLFSIHMGLMIAIWLLIGLISLEGIPNYQTTGWGIFSTNLNSLYNPMRFGASIMPTLPYFDMQHLEGYAYLGFGLLSLIAICVILYVARLFTRKQNEKWHFLTMGNIQIAPLLLYIVFSSFFALTNKITWNQNVILEYPLSDIFANITNSFRSSGRLFWPTYYFLITLLFYSFSRLNLKVVTQAIILTGCLTLQLYDIQGFLRPIPVKYEVYKPPIHKVWNRLIQSFDKLLFYPGFRRSYLSFDDYRYFMYYTVRYQKKINIGYPSRFDRDKANVLIGELGDQITNDGLDDSTLYIAFACCLNRLAPPINNNEAYVFNIDGYLAIFKKTKNNEALYEYLKENVGEEKKNELLARFNPRAWKNPGEPGITKTAKTGVYTTDDTEGHYYIQGWAFDDQSKNIPGDSIYLVLESVVTKERLIAPTYKFGTQDVADFYANPELGMVGFAASLLKNNLRNEIYHVGLLFTNGSSGLHSVFWMEQFIHVKKPVTPKVITDPSKGLPRIKFGLYGIDYTAKDVSIACWAFPESGICKSCKPYFVLKGKRTTYAIEAAILSRSDVVSFFKDSTLLNSGLEATFRNTSMPRGFYKLGILMKDTVKSIEYTAETDQVIAVGMDEYIVPQVLNPAVQGKDSIQAYIDTVEEKEESYQLAGWAFISGLSTDFSEASVVLKSDDAQYIFETIQTSRPDVQEHFKYPYDLEMAGFSLKFKKKSLPSGKYEVCVILQNKKTNVRSMSCLGNIIKI